MQENQKQISIRCIFTCESSYCWSAS